MRLICECKEKYLDYSQEVCWFSKVAVVSSSPRFMTWLTLEIGQVSRTRNDFSLIEQALYPSGELLDTTNVCVPLLKSYRYFAILVAVLLYGCHFLVASFHKKVCIVPVGIMKASPQGESFKIRSCSGLWALMSKSHAVFNNRDLPSMSRKQLRAIATDSTDLGSS